MRSPHLKARCLRWLLSLPLAQPLVEKYGLRLRLNPQYPKQQTDKLALARSLFLSSQGALA
ncbi:hypothetical protein [Nostoc sp.]|uniref:hypothetical protein n=1 Tax=Nostoc sp. TaxID=1180 RepID=UPI002FF75CEF